MDITTWVTETVNQYQDYALWLILLFGILHPLTENPWSFLTLSLAITFLGIPLGYSVVLLGNIIGILLLYLIIHGLRRLSKDAYLDKKIPTAVLKWINETESWRHILVLGMPTVPTYPVKIALPLSDMRFMKYSITIFGSYLFLHIANSLLYFGVLGFITDGIPRALGIALLILFAILIYFGKSMWPFGHKIHNEVKE